MNEGYWTRWLKAALIRSLRTVAQTACSLFSVGMALYEIDFKYVASVSLVAGLFSLLTSLAGLPEVESEGIVDDSE